MKKLIDFKRPAAFCTAKDTSNVPTLHPPEISSAFSCDSDATQDPLVAIEFSVGFLHSQNQQPLPTAAPRWDDLARPMLVSFLLIHENVARSTLKRIYGLESLLNLRVYIQGDPGTKMEKHKGIGEFDDIEALPTHCNLMTLAIFWSHFFQGPCNTLHCVFFGPPRTKKTKKNI